MSIVGEKVLNLSMPKGNDADANNIRHYLKKLLQLVWDEDEGFDGKRPFGNSGWWNELYVPLVKSGLVEGNFDEFGYLECDESAAHDLISEAISSL